MKKQKTPIEIVDVSSELQKANVFNFENISKEGIAHAAQMIAEPIIDGQMSPHRKMIQFMAMRDILDEVISNIKPAAMEELRLQKGESRDVYGAKIETTSTAKYDFSGCGHSEWEMLNQQEKAIAEKRKKIEAFLKTLEGSVYLEETAEQVFPPKKTGSETLKVTFKKSIQ